MDTNTNKRKRNSVLFVTSQPAVSDWLYEHFASGTALGTKFYVEGSVSTREAAIELVNKKRPTLVLFFEKTVGLASISHTVYQFRKAGARVLFIGTDRLIGDLVLETLVSYGVYDLILDKSIDSEKLQSIIENPRDFKDVSVFMREVKLADDGATGKEFVINGIDSFLGYSEVLENDYLIDPEEKAIRGTKAVIRDEREKRSFTSSLLKEKAKKDRFAKPVETEATYTKTSVKKKKEAANKPKAKTSGLLGDLD